MATPLSKAGDQETRRLCRPQVLLELSSTPEGSRSRSPAHLPVAQVLPKEPACCTYPLGHWCLPGQPQPLPPLRLPKRERQGLARQRTDGGLRQTP